MIFIDFLPVVSIRGHVQRCPLQLPVSGDLRLPGPPHARAPGVRRAASQRSAAVAPGIQRGGHVRRRSAREHHLACQTLPHQPDAAVPAREGSGQVPETEVPLVPRLGGAVTARGEEF